MLEIEPRTSCTTELQPQTLIREREFKRSLHSLPLPGNPEIRKPVTAAAAAAAEAATEAATAAAVAATAAAVPQAMNLHTGPDCPLQKGV